MTLSRLTVATVQNLVIRSEEPVNASWTKNTGITATDNTTDVTDPTGGSTAGKLVYDGSGVAAAPRFYKSPVATLTNPNANTPYMAAFWAKVSSGTRTMRLTCNGLTALDGSTALPNIALTTTWTYFSIFNKGFVNGSLLQWALYDGLALNSAFTLYVWAMHVKQGNGPGGYVKTSGSAVDTGVPRLVA